MNFVCPFCATDMQRAKHDRRALECLQCGTMGTANILHSQHSNALTMRRMEQLANELSGNDAAPITRSQCAGLIRRTLFRPGGP